MESMGAIVFCSRENGRKSLFLEDLLFAPAALWLAEGLKEQGITRFFVVCHSEDSETLASCFPSGTQMVSTGTPSANECLSAFLAECTGAVTVITRPVFLLPAGVLSQGGECGAFTISAQNLSQSLAEGVEFEPALRGTGTPLTTCQIFTREGRARMAAEQAAKARSVERLLADGVRIMDPNGVYVGPLVTVEEGTLLLPGTILRGETKIGKNCVLGPNTVIRDCTLADEITVNASQLNESTVESGAQIGPFAYVRPHCHIGAKVKVGDFVELKNSVVGNGTKISHLTYVGDADVGERVNFGCGTVTVNYDGDAKFRTTVGDDAFIGCNTNLVAPVTVGDGAYTAAGSTITEDVPTDSLAIARNQQVVKKQWAAKRRSHKK